MLIVLPRFGFASAVECQGYNNISKDRFYYSNYNGYILIFEDYYAWLSLIDRYKDRYRYGYKNGYRYIGIIDNNRRYKDRDRDRVNRDRNRNRNCNCNCDCRKCRKCSKIVAIAK